MRKTNFYARISLLKLKTLPEGDVDFIDINSADTPEGRTECIVNATDNLIDTFFLYFPLMLTPLKTSQNTTSIPLKHPQISPK